MGERPIKEVHKITNGMKGTEWHIYSHNNHKSPAHLVSKMYPAPQKKIYSLENYLLEMGFSATIHLSIPLYWASNNQVSICLKVGDNIARIKH